MAAMPVEIRRYNGIMLDGIKYVGDVEPGFTAVLDEPDAPIPFDLFCSFVMTAEEERQFADRRNAIAGGVRKSSGF